MADTVAFASAQWAAGIQRGTALYNNSALDDTGAIIDAANRLRVYGVRVDASGVGPYDLANGDSGFAYLKLYQKQTAPTGSDTPTLVIEVPAGTVFECEIPAGVLVGDDKTASDADGLGVRCTNEEAVADADAPQDSSHADTTVDFSLLYEVVA